MPPRISPPSASLSNSCQCLRQKAQHQLQHVTGTVQPSRNASHTSRASRHTKLRRDMWEWLDGPGKVFRDPVSGGTNYMSAYDRNGRLNRSKEGSRGDKDSSAQESASGDADSRSKERPGDMRPYPLNHNFRSQPVLSEDLREEIYQQVVERGADITTVSAAFSVDVRRVAAVVRLKTIEKQWVADGKTLATPYNEAVLAMLPQTPFDAKSSRRITPHEGINDLVVHSKTRQQIFYPTSESREFTRQDAAQAFHDTLLPADQRIPHPELITLEKEHMQGISRDERWERQRERDVEAEKERESKLEKRLAWEKRSQVVVPGRRWDFKFQNISVESAGKDGRSRHGVGARYGMPHDDRKRGKVKIPTSVE